MSATSSSRESSKQSEAIRGHWANTEDIALCTAWIRTSFNSEQIMNQRSATFWERIRSEYYAQENEDSRLKLPARSVSGLESRFHTIKASVGKFCVCYARALGLNRGDHSVDTICKAMELYEIEEKKAAANEADDPEEPEFTKTKSKKAGGKKFVFLHCWRVLRDQPKWHRELEIIKRKAMKKRQNGVAPAVVDQSTSLLTSNSEAIKEEIQDTPSPICQNHVQVKRPFSELCESMRVLIELSRQREEQFEAQKERIAASDKEDRLIMETDVSFINDPEHKEYIQLRKKQILNRLRESAQQ